MSNVCESANTASFDVGGVPALKITSDNCFLRSMYSSSLMPIWFNVMSLKGQGFEVLQHHTSEPKQVAGPSPNLVSLANFCLMSKNS